ncbi:hypothetical protein [Streptomyces agglomeratus]|uniref:hypothetical protein n=1 Tax=Streptomyces agglomeratus TaxID=285458 RepID=UPI00159F1F69|nr:hypothetical protein [Streptomyces agglomeratus]
MSTDPTSADGTNTRPQPVVPQVPRRGWRPSRNAIRISVFAVAVIILIIAGEIRRI